MTKMLRERIVQIALSAVSSAALMTIATSAAAQVPRRAFDIPAQPLGSALLAFSQQGDVMVVVPPELAAGKRSVAVKGTLSTDEAIRELLRTSGLRAVATAEGGYRAVPFAERKPQLPASRADASASLAAAGADPAGQVEDIVVFGRKRARAEELQRTPISVTALGAAQLQRPTIRDLIDVGRLSTNASFQPAAQKGVQNFVIRGTGVSGTNPSDEPAVGIFQDGVYWGSNYGALNELLDVEGVEILRGPQGTLFGRNVTGGAVTVRSARPGQTPYHRFSAGVSNGMGIEGSAVVNKPLGDTVAVRLAALARANRGVFKNIISDRSFGETYVTMLRPSIRWEPSELFDVTLLGEYYQVDGHPTAIRGLSPTTFPGPTPSLAERAGFRSSTDYSELQVGDEGFSHLKVYFTMGEANLQIGPGILTSITGYRKVSSHNQVDFDGFPVDGFVQTATTSQHQFSQELRYAADLTDWLSLTGGVYYFDQRFQYREMRDIANHTVLSATRSYLDNSSYAAFLETDIRPIDDLTITLGGRYTHEKKKAVTAPFGACPFNFTAPCSFQTRPAYSADNFSPKVGLSYQIDPTKMLFASYTRGFRSGGYSLRGTPLGAPYKAETVEAYEAGFKSDLLDRRVRFNLAGFYNKFSDLQRTVVGVDPILGTVQSVFNAADATIEGVEVELTVVPVTGLSLTGNYGYTLPRYKSFLGSSNPEAIKFIRVSRQIANTMIDYELQLANGDRAAFHIGGSYMGRNYFDEGGLVAQPGYWLLDASIAYTFNDRVTLSAYSRNLTDKNYAFWGTVPLGAIGQNYLVGEPRTYGLRAAFTF